MPRKQTVQRARSAKREGKAPTTQAGEFVREEMEKMDEGGARAPRSRKQAIAIGLSQARRSGVDIPKRGAKKGARKADARKTSGRKAASSRKASSRKASSRTSAKRASGRKTTRKSSSRKRTSAKRASQ